MTLEILICSLDKGIVRVQDVMLEPQEGIRYIVSYQYTDERYLDLIPSKLYEREDVLIFTYKGKGLSANRNLALDKATADIVMYADDDAHILPETPALIHRYFEEKKEMDVAFFCATTYTGKPLKKYSDKEFRIQDRSVHYNISALEMVFRRSSVQGKIRFDERFGLGTKFLTCGEEEVWLEDAFRAKLEMFFIPEKIVETSTMLKKSLIYVDAGVQRSRGAIEYYRYGGKAWWRCFQFACESARKGCCHFWPMMKHLMEGIRFMKRTDSND